VAAWHELRESNQPPFVDQEVPEVEPREPAEAWPRLPPAGIQPEVPPEETQYRGRV